MRVEKQDLMVPERSFIKDKLTLAKTQERVRQIETEPEKYLETSKTEFQKTEWGNISMLCTTTGPSGPADNNSPECQSCLNCQKPVQPDQ